MILESEPIIYAKTPHARISQNIPNFISMTLIGKISPYPTVVMVVKAQ
jgi:hypothetical protein